MKDAQHFYESGESRHESPIAFKPADRAGFVPSHKATVAFDICTQDGTEFAFGAFLDRGFHTFNTQISKRPASTFFLGTDSSADRLLIWKKCSML